MNPLKIVIIGSGNVAHHLVKSVTSSGHKLVQIYNRTIQNVDLQHQSIDVSDDLNMLYREADIYIICVKDDAIPHIAERLRLDQKLVLHTSGNKSMDIISKCSQNYGIFYPIQSFTKEIPIDFKKIPIVIEGSNHVAFRMLKNFALSISTSVIEMNEEKRQKLNIAGVFVNNFTNLIFSEVYEYLSQNDLDFSILLPLIQNTVDKLNLHPNPRTLQTGPAIRQDLQTIDSQANLIRSHAFLSEVYSLFTKRILEHARA